MLASSGQRLERIVLVRDREDDTAKNSIGPNDEFHRGNLDLSDDSARGIDPAILGSAVARSGIFSISLRAILSGPHRRATVPHPAKSMHEFVAEHSGFE